jgi:hypothetical protein
MGLAAASDAQTCLSCVGNLSHAFKSQRPDKVPLEQGRIEPRRTVAAMGSKVDASSGQPLEGPWVPVAAQTT